MKRLVSFEVDQGRLFDTLALTGDWGAIGQRIIGAMLADDCPASDLVGMAIYGIILMPVVPSTPDHPQQNQDQGGAL